MPPRERVSGLTLLMWRLRCDVKIVIIVVLCLVRATAAEEAAIRSSEASQADALASLNDKLDRLTSKLESLTVSECSSRATNVRVGTKSAGDVSPATLACRS